MILDSLELSNIRSHKKTTIKFSEGITLLSGDVGSGKSTVLMGIEFALFGLGSFKADSLLTKNENSGEVMLTFYVGDNRYEIGRTLTRAGKKVAQNSKDSYLKVNGSLEPLTTSELKPRVLEILGLNEPSSANAMSRIYRYAVYTPQDEMKAILWDPKARLETIRKAFRMEDYQTAIKNADHLKSAIKEMMSRFEGRFEGLQRAESELDAAGERLEEIVRVIGEQEKSEQEHAGREDAAKAAVERFRTRMQQKNALKQQQAAAEANLRGEEHMQDAHVASIGEDQRRMESIRTDLTKLEAIHRPTEKTIDQIQKEIKYFEQLNTDISVTSEKIRSAKERIDLLEQRLQECGSVDADILKERIESLISKTGSYEEELEGLRLVHDNAGTAKMKMQGQVENLRESIQNIMGLGAKCRLCGHILTEEHLTQQRGLLQRNLDDAEDELVGLEAAYRTQASTIMGVEDTLRTAKAEINSLENAVPDADELVDQRQHLTDLQKQLAKFVVQNRIEGEPVVSGDDRRGRTPLTYLSALKDDLAEYEGAARRATDMREELARFNTSIHKTRTQLVESRARAEELKDELAKISGDLDSYAADDEEITKTNAELEEIQYKLRQIRDELSAKRASRGHESDNIKRLESEIQDATTWMKRHQRYARYLNWIGDFFVPNIYQIEKQILLSIQQSFNESYHGWYARLIDDPTKDSYIDEEFTPIVEQNGYIQDVNFLSGGEKTSVALSYRLALNFMMRRETRSLESNLLILDEPTDGFSRAQLSNVRGLLEGLNSKQIILVSHEPELESHVDHVLYVKKDAGITTVSPPATAR